MPGSRVWKRVIAKTTRLRARRSSRMASRLPFPDDAERKNWKAVGTEAFKELAEQGGISPAMLKALNAALAEVRGGAK